jgi:hypothetical protein
VNETPHTRESGNATLYTHKCRAYLLFKCENAESQNAGRCRIRESVELNSAV